MDLHEIVDRIRKKYRYPRGEHPLLAFCARILLGPNNEEVVPSATGMALLSASTAVVAQNALVAAGSIYFGSTTAAYPMLKRNGTDIEVKLADDSAFTALRCRDLTVDRNLLATTLPTTDPGAGGQFWYDPTDGNRVKYSVG